MDTRDPSTDDDPHGLNDNEFIRKDTSYSPASDTESARIQDDDRSEELRADDIDPARVRTLPGAGGPDDAGDVDAGDLDISDIARRGHQPGPDAAESDESDEQE